MRGQTYTFVVEGGQDIDRPSRYHPFYITDDPEGGYEFKTPAERAVSLFNTVVFKKIQPLIVHEIEIPSVCRSTIRSGWEPSTDC